MKKQTKTILITAAVTFGIVAAIYYATKPKAAYGNGNGNGNGDEGGNGDGQAPNNG